MKRIFFLTAVVALFGINAFAQQPNTRGSHSTDVMKNMGNKRVVPFQNRDDTAAWLNSYPCDTIFGVFGSLSGGAISGHNTYLDSSKAEQYTAIPGDKIVGMLLWFGYAGTSTQTTQKIHVNIWDANGPSGSPGTKLGNADVLQSTIKTDVTNGELTLVWFSAPITMPAGGNFYAGIGLEYKKVQGKMKYDSTRMVAIVNNDPSDPANPDSLNECSDQVGENTAWEQWHYSPTDPINYDGAWHPYSDVYSAAYRNQIYPIVVTESGCTVTISPSSSTICKGTTVALTASGGSTYTWAPATGLNVTTGAVVNAKPTATTTYTVTANGGACTATITMTVNKKPVANFTQGTCSGGHVLLTRTGTPASGVTFKWFRNGGAISGATNSTYSASLSGDYKVRVTITATGCSKTSTVQTVTVNCKMAEESTSAFSASAYPNPFTKTVSVNIATVSPDAAQVSVMDFSGRTLTTFSDVDATVPFEINEDLTPGVYFIKVTQGSNEQIIKVVKSE